MSPTLAASPPAPAPGRPRCLAPWAQEQLQQWSSSLGIGHRRRARAPAGRGREGRGPVKFAGWGRAGPGRPSDRRRCPLTAAHPGKPGPLGRPQTARPAPQVPRGGPTWAAHGLGAAAAGCTARRLAAPHGSGPASALRTHL